VLARRLEVEAFGGYNFLFTFIYFFLTFNDLGIPTTLMREITQAPERTTELVQNIVGLRLTLALASMMLGWSVVSWLDLPPAYRLPQLVFLLILPVQALATPIAVLQSRIQIGRAVAVELTNRLTGFVLMLVVLALGQGLLWVTIALVIGELAGSAVIWRMTWNVVRPRPRFDVAVWRRMLRMSLPLSGSSLMVAVLNRIDIVLVQRMAPSPEVGLVRVGYYGSAYRVPNLCERVPLLMMNTILPMMFRFAATDVAALKRLHRKTTVQISLLAVPMVLVVWVSAPYVVRVWMGPDYLPVVPLMRALIWASALLYVTLPSANLMIALRRQHINFWLMMPAMAINVILNLLWIPAYGAEGAAWATVAAYAFLAVAFAVAAAIVIPTIHEARA
jgi:O-antigen/teichoic acid export membrane protein